jgi:putative NADPH-quinone reductase
VWTYGYAYTCDDSESGVHLSSNNPQGRVPQACPWVSTIKIKKALVIYPAGHTVEHLEEIGIAECMRRVMIEDCLLGVGVKEAHMEIPGGMVLGDETCRTANLEKAYQVGREFSLPI